MRVAADLNLLAGWVILAPSFFTAWLPPTCRPVELLVFVYIRLQAVINPHTGAL